MKTDLLRNKTILVTGGTGSFGSAFIKYLLNNSEAKKIIVFSRDEFKQSKMETEINDERLRFFLGDVRDPQRIERALNGVDIVIHAAALKQVPKLEYNPFEAIKTNILGTQNIIDAAINQGIKKILLISTDKAVHPINLYGATKLCAEKLFINSNVYTPNNSDKSVFSVVRYGNVLGSRGSIVESLLRNKHIEKVQITDTDMTRFWITLEQTFALVMFALENMRGGEIFVPKIPSMKLTDLFDTIVPGAKKEIIGIRPGEKLHEILLTQEEAIHAIETDKYFAIIPHNKNLDFFADPIRNGNKLSPDFNYRSITNNQWLTKEELKKIINNY